MATCSICTMKVVNLATHIVARHSQPTLTREGRDLPREGLGEEEEMTFTNINININTNTNINININTNTNININIGGNPEPSTSMSRKRKTRGFEEEGRHGPIGPDSRLATGTLMVGQGRRKEEEEEDKLVRENIEFSDSSDDDEEEEEEEGETQASTRRVSTGRPLSSVDVLDNLRLRNMAGVERLANLRRRIQQQLRKNENKSP